MCLTLTRRPKFVNQIRNRPFSQFPRRLAEVPKISDQIDKRTFSHTSSRVRDFGKLFEEWEPLESWTAHVQILQRVKRAGESVQLL